MDMSHGLMQHVDKPFNGKIKYYYEELGCKMRKLNEFLKKLNEDIDEFDDSEYLSREHTIEK